MDPFSWPPGRRTILVDVNRSRVSYRFSLPAGGRPDQNRP